MESSPCLRQGELYFSKKRSFFEKGLRFDCAQNFVPQGQNSTLAQREVLYPQGARDIRKAAELPTAVLFRSAEPPDTTDFHFISPCGAKLYEVLMRKAG